MAKALKWRIVDLLADRTGPYWYTGTMRGPNAHRDGHQVLVGIGVTPQFGGWTLKAPGVRLRGSALRGLGCDHMRAICRSRLMTPIPTVRL